jgi:hypothetical protein
MAWVTPPTFSDGTLLTASQLNTLSGDLNETAVSKATTAGRFFASTGVDSIAERVPNAGTITTSETTASTSFGHLATIGPDTQTTVTGPLVLLILGAVTSNNTVNAETYMGYQISGATTQAASDAETLRHTSATANAMVACSWAYLVPVTAGSNFFRANYRVSSGTGAWSFRRISLIPF